MADDSDDSSEDSSRESEFQDAQDVEGIARRPGEGSAALAVPALHAAVVPEARGRGGRGIAAAVAPAGRVAGRASVRGGRAGGRGQSGGRAGRGGRGGRISTGRPIGRTNYSADEVEHMFDSIREYLPISGLEWELVAQRHMAFHPDQERTGDQLKKKFNKLAKTKMGTGDPNMPADVREAKAIRKLIVEKSEGVTGSEDEPFALEEDGEDYIADEEDDPNGGDVAGADVMAGIRLQGDNSVAATNESVSPHPGVSAIHFY
jgi:hypothetical protein